MSVGSDGCESPSMNLYRLLPSVNEVLLMQSVEGLLRSNPRKAVVYAVQAVLDSLRNETAQGIHSEETLRVEIEHLPEAVFALLKRPVDYSLRRVINATGVILHTNLGRAPLSRAALDHLVETAQGYSNLEFNLDTGERGSRDVHVESLLVSVLSQAAGLGDLTNSHRAIVVNNCAAATFLVLHALAKGNEVIVSRGELIEIGGGFRIPEILEASGAILKEVGTTNRTRISDYERALSPNTGLILRVHQSNFSMEGFVEKPPLEELVALGKRAKVPVFIDQGTGLVDLVPRSGLESEVTLVDCAAKGFDLIAASGDKLLGGPQCGILVGRRDVIDQIRRDPLFRTFRVDKLILAALEATLAAYAAHWPEAIPVQRMLHESSEGVRMRCERVVQAIGNADLMCSIVSAESVIGGGTAPKARLQSFAVSLRHRTVGSAELLGALRRCNPPVIARIEDNQVFLDLRTVDPDSDAVLIGALNGLRVSELSTRKEVPTRS